MRIVVSASEADLDAQASPAFGRCPKYIFVDTDTMAFEASDNPAMNAAGGAGIRAAQYVTDQGAEAVITGNVGPNAFGVLQAANVPVHLFRSGTVRQAVEAFKAGRLSATGGATARAHAGMGAAAPATAPSREGEIAALKQKVGALRQQLADVVEQLDRLEKEG